MLDKNASGSITPQGEVVQTIARSVVTHYWQFTVAVLAFTAVGFSLAPTFDAEIALVSLLAIYTGLEGLHNIDLANPEVATNLDKRIQWVMGFGLTAVGAILGGWIALQTSLLFLAFVVVEIVAGVAYNAELFDGLFHDLDKLGLHNFGFSWAMVPAIGGYFVMEQTITVGIVLIGAALAAYSAALLVLFEVSKVVAIYDDVGIVHSREYDLSAEEAARESARALNHIIVGSVLLALGAFSYGVLGV